MTHKNRGNDIVRDKHTISLVMLGAGRRAVIAAIVVAALWAMFFWATFSPSGL